MDISDIKWVEHTNSNGVRHKSISTSEGKLRAMVSQSPTIPEVMYPGTWSGSIVTKDDGMIGTPHYETEEEAIACSEAFLLLDFPYSDWESLMEIVPENSEVFHGTRDEIVEAITSFINKE